MSAAAEEAFRTYGWHMNTCPAFHSYERDCNCGFHEAWDDIVIAAKIASRAVLVRLSEDRD